MVLIFARFITYFTPKGQENKKKNEDKAKLVIDQDVHC